MEVIEQVNARAKEQVWLELVRVVREQVWLELVSLQLRTSVYSSTRIRAQMGGGHGELEKS
jgi:hypothetical protein